ncbi:hypothetical protein, partial [Moraxella catarrhalis]|uniref:hypothetical protein n=1 Tax=Moraxella catarrhalis TaxID=480 RepID=UPI001C7CA434
WFGCNNLLLVSKKYTNKILFIFNTLAIKKQINISVDDKKPNPKVNNIRFTLELAKNSSMQMAKNIKKPKINEMMNCFF